MTDSSNEQLSAIAEDARIARENTEEILRLLQTETDRDEATVVHRPVGTDATGRGFGHRH